jgi:hypothetical protein
VQILCRLTSPATQAASALIWLTDLAADHRTLKALISPKYACEKQQLSIEKKDRYCVLKNSCAFKAHPVLHPLCEGQLPRGPRWFWNRPCRMILGTFRNFAGMLKSSGAE